MRTHAKSGRLVLLLAVALNSAGTAPAVAAPADQVSVVDGTIAAVNGSTLTIALGGGGQKVIRVGPDTLILRRETATLSAIKPGDAMGVAAKRGEDGSLTAISIVIFSRELWTRARKGQWPMESGDIMTNAVVMQFADRVEGRTLYLKYADGAAAVIVPATAQIRRLITVGLSDLRPGLRVTARGPSDTDGTIRAATITFDRPG